VTDPLEPFRRHLEALRESENLNVRQLELERERSANTRVMVADLLSRDGSLYDAGVDLLDSAARSRAAAEAAFAASVESREAAERLLRQLETR